MKKVFTVDAAACLLTWHDEINAACTKLIEFDEKEFASATAAHHDRVIKINRLKKHARELKAMITVEMASALDERARLQEEYKFKTTSDFTEPPTLRETLSIIRSENK